MEHRPECVCDGLKIIATILERPVIERILTHLGPNPHPHRRVVEFNGLDPGARRIGFAALASTECGTEHAQAAPVSQQRRVRAECTGCASRTRTAGAAGAACGAVCIAEVLSEALMTDSFVARARPAPGDLRAQLQATVKRNPSRRQG